jgi:hypothetical protein
VSAEIHDLLLVDTGDGVLTRGEASRALEFARLARNSASRTQLKLLLALSRDVDMGPILGEQPDQEDGDGLAEPDEMMRADD